MYIYLYIYIYIYETLGNLKLLTFVIMPHKKGCAVKCAFTLQENETQKRADAFTSSRAQVR